MDKPEVSGKPGSGNAKSLSHGLSDIPPSVVTALQGGDHEAFKYIYLHFSDNLTRFLGALLRSEDEAREMTQNIFITLWEKRAIFDPAKGLRRYIYQLAKFYALDHFDKRKVRVKYEEFCQRGDIYDLAADDIMQGKETEILVEHVINSMPERQRQVFRMNREDKKSYEEIAGELGISINTVKHHIKVSLKELRDILALFFILFVD